MAETMKVSERIAAAAAEGRPFFSFEYFPPKTEAGVRNLYERLDRMRLLGASFIDVTWGAGGTTSDLTLELCNNAQKYCGMVTQMHLTCTNMPLEKLEFALKTAKEYGIRSILALRGDPPVGQERWTAVEGGFNYATDLVRYIRSNYGDYFSIAVAGYPEGHLDAASYQEDLDHLKEKIDAGADLIITQLFYNNARFLKFVEDCRAKGINVPIIPGIMPIQSFGSFNRMTTFCKTDVPQSILDALEPIKEDDAAVKEYGIQLGVKMCKELLDAGTPGLHFYTLNLEKSVVGILRGLELITEQQRELPWTKSLHMPRLNEDVRPIFWQNRPKSYIERTSSWDDFPNGRWGATSSPAYGSLRDYHLFTLHGTPANTAKNMWGEAPARKQDIYKIFVSYLRGDIQRLPWSESGLHLESEIIKDHLVLMNHHGFLTINSQPRVNGCDSDDPTFGWGGEGGFVFQKAYIEFFCPPSHLEILEKLVTTKAKYKSLSFSAVNNAGDQKTNAKAATPTAVTWGVFPDREVLQPTVVDPLSFFGAWKEEAFTLWTASWQRLYEEGSPSHKLIGEIHDNFYLVNIVDNDFVRGDIFAVFRELIPMLSE